MKTLSARIRGSKVELEELGEAEEDVVNLTSKLRREVKAMTGFDIMENEDTYKSIDEIIIGIGKHWKELTDIQQAALAEDLAGKRNSNVLIALLQNAELVEEVYDKATHSANSAAKEQENYMMSIQYSLDRFNASMQEIEADLVSSQLVKDIVDIGTTIVNFLDAIVEHIGLLGAGATVAGIASLVKNFKELKAALESAVVLGKAAQLMSVGQAEEVAVTEALAVATEHLSFAQAQAVLTTNGMTAAEAKDILTKAGYTGATVSATASTKAFTTALLANVKAMGAMLVSNPVLLALVAITAAVAGVAIAFDAATVSVEESKKKLDEYGKSVSDLKSELEQLRNLEEKTPKDNKRIEYLERELQIQERLLEIEQQRYYKNLTERTFANAFDPDNIATQQDKNAARETNNGGTARYIADLDRQVKKLRDLDDQIKKVGEDSDEFEKLENKRKKALSKGDDYYSALLDEYKTYAQQEEQLTEALSAKTSSGFNMLTGKARENAQKSLLYAADELREITETLRAFEITKGEYDPFNVVTGIEFEPVVNEIKNVVNSSGDLETAQKRLLAQFPSLEGMCTKYGITLEELVEHYYNLEEAAEAAADAELKQGSSLSTSVSNMNSRILPQFEELGKVYDEIFNGDKGFDLSHIGTGDLEGIRSAFEDLDEDLDIDWESKTEDVDKFLSVIGSSSSTAQEVQGAFNDLATSYFNAAKASGDFTEENARVLEQMLREMGVVNANEVVMAELNAQMEVQANTANALAAASSDMAGETENASAKFVQEAQMSNLAKVYLADLVATETVFNNTGLNVDDKVAALSELATAYFGTAAAAKLVEMTNNRGYEHSYSVSPEEAWRQIVGEFTKIEMPTIDFSGSGKNTKAAGGAGKEAADTYVEAFEKELKALEEQRDAGILSEKQFLDKYRALIEKYFKDVDGYGEEYAKRMADYFQRTISYLESVFSAVGTLLDKRISAAQKGKDAAVQALNDEKDAAAEAYQSQIDHIDELIEAKEKEIDLIDDEIKGYEDQIKAIDDQIDALEEANQKRQQAINLQKAEYQLQRSLNQKTRLVYKDSQMVYENDPKEVRQARENLEDAEFEIQKQQLEDLKKPLQEQIDLLEKQKDLIEDEIEAYKKQQEELKKALEASNAYYDDLIKQTERYWDAIIDGLEKQKSKWEELAEFKEIANAYALIQEAGEELGYSVEDILNDVPGAFEAFRDAYLNVLQEANSGNQNFLDGLAYATGAAKDNVNASLTEISTKASEVSTALEPLSDVSAKVEDTATALGNVATNGGTAASSVGTLGDKLNDVAGSSEGISDIDDSIQNIASTSLGDTVQAFNDLYEALDKCAQALGIGEGEMSTFESALKAISEISLGDDTTGAIGAFTALAGAVDTVTSAIGGGGGGSSDDPTESKSDSMSDGASGGLITAIEEMKEAADTNIGTSSSVGEGGATGSSGDGGTVISDFDALYGSINNVIELIGNSKDDYSEDGATLINAVKGLPVVGKEAITGEAGVVPMFEELLEAISKCVEQAQKLLAALREIKELRESLGSEDGMATGNVHIGQYATGNVHGNAYASGRLGLKKSENALVGEIGQELVYNPSTGTYRTVGDHGPEITRLQKGDLVFNAEQTKAIIKHGKRHGNSYANGTGLVPLSDAETNMFKTIGNALMGIKADTSQMLEPVRTLAKNVSKVTTNNVNPVININGTSFTVAGVTGEAVALQIQDVFAGLVSNAYQRAMK